MLKWFILISPLFLTGCFILGLSNVPEPEYQILLEEKSKDVLFQVRDYSELVIAETIVESEDFDEVGNIGFKRLGGYIFGENKKAEEIEMTAPVLLDRNSEKKSWKMTFILPKEYTLEKAPPPEDQKVTIKTVKEKRFAVAKFSGFLSESNFNEHTDKLLEWMRVKNYPPLSDPILAGYNPPWTPPFFRRNEVFIEISKESKNL